MAKPPLTATLPTAADELCDAEAEAAEVVRTVLDPAAATLLLVERPEAVVATTELDSPVSVGTTALLQCIQVAKWIIQNHSCRRQKIQETHVSRVSVPVASGSVPVARGSVPVARGSVPVSRVSVPRVSVPVARGSVPVASGSVPVASGSVPYVHSENVFSTRIYFTRRITHSS